MAIGAGAAQDPPEEAQFRSGVDLIHVAATVTDDQGHFVRELRESDFTIYEDGVRQDIAYFSSERVSVSLGLLLDASGSMTREKMAAAVSAINRFVFDLLDPSDELFFSEFANTPVLTQEWTTDRAAIGRAVRHVSPGGGTALYDAIADALPVAETGRHRKRHSSSSPTATTPTAPPRPRRFDERFVRATCWCMPWASTALPNPPR